MASEAKELHVMTIVNYLAKANDKRSRDAITKRLPEGLSDNFKKDVLKIAKDRGFIINRKSENISYYFHADFAVKVNAQLDAEALVRRQESIKRFSEKHNKLRDTKSKAQTEENKKAIAEGRLKTIISFMRNKDRPVTRDEITEGVGFSRDVIRPILKSSKFIREIRFGQPDLFTPKEVKTKVNMFGDSAILARMFDPYPAAVWHY